jgi:TonB family protein
MTTKFALISSRWARYLCTSLPLVFLAIALTHSPPGAYAQKQTVQKLTLAQVEQLVSHGVPDSTMAAQVQKRGIAFKPTPEILKELQDKGAGPLTIAAVQPSPSDDLKEQEVPGGMLVPGGVVGGVVGGELPPPPPPPAAPPSGRIRISSGIAESLLIKKTDPVYPPLARAARIAGTVVLQIVISKTGSVENLHLVSGHPLLVQAALDAVKEWRYQPFMLNGEPVEVETTISVTFDWRK